MSTEGGQRWGPGPGRRGFLRLAGVTIAGLATAMPAVGLSPGDAAVPGGPGHDPAASDSPVTRARVVVPMLFPVLGGASYTDTFLACRGTHCERRHLGQDLLAPKLRPLLAVFDGTITYLRRERAAGQGNYLSLRSDTGWTCNYLHVNNDRPGTDDGLGSGGWAFPPGVRVGARVFAGQHVAWLGDSGNAEGTAAHCHFELRLGDAWSGTVHNPKPSLDAALRLTQPRPSGPHPNGVLLSAAPGSGVYLLEAGRTRQVHDLALAGYHPGAVVGVQPAELGWYPRGAPMPVPDGLVVRDPQGRCWVAAGGERVRVADAAALARLGVPRPRIRPVDAVTMAATPPCADQAPLGLVRLGALLRPGGPQGAGQVDQVWRIQAGWRRPVPDAATFASWGWSADDVAVVPAGQLEEVPAGAPLPLRDGTLVRAASGPVYLVTDGLRRWVPSALVLRAYRYPAAAILTGVPAAVIARLPLGPPLP